jgi:putative ABC transport system ATP-binding protein
VSIDPTLDVRDVTHGVLNHVSLEAQAGTIVALTGHSGSGKSTLCHLIAGLERPEQGTVLLDGRPTVDVTDWARISVVPQRLSLLEQLTAVENLVLPVLTAGRTPDIGATHRLLDALGVDLLSDRPAGKGSIGEQQRIAVARALVLESPLIVLDEPTAHQDDENAGRVIDAITAVARRGALVVTSTHDPRLLAESAYALALGSG